MIVDIVVRAGVVVALIIATKHYGVWDSPDRTQELYNSSSEHVEPYANNARQRLGFNPPQPPPEGKWKFFGVYYYNQVVITFFSFLNYFPTVLGQGLEQVPGYASQMFKSVKQQYEKYRQKPTDKKSCQGSCVDQLPLVQPIEPDPNPPCKSRRSVDPKETPQDKVKPSPRKRFEDDDIYKSRLPLPEMKPKCGCTKCKRREDEGWSDNKPKCRNRLPPDNETDKEQPPKKKCKICSEDPIKTDKNKEDRPKRESLKTCKKCTPNAAE